MEGQQGAVAKSADELEVICACCGVAFPNPTDLAIFSAGGTVCEPSREIGNVSVDGYGHASIIQPGPLAADLRFTPLCYVGYLLSGSAKTYSCAPYAG